MYLIMFTNLLLAIISALPALAFYTLREQTYTLLAHMSQIYKEYV